MFQTSAGSYAVYAKNQSSFYIPDKYNPMLAGILNFFIPTVGYLYVGKYWTFLFVWLICAITAATWVVPPAIWVFTVIHIFFATRSINESHRRAVKNGYRM